MNTYIKRREKEDNTYSRLQQQSLKMLQALSGDYWTDFNEHDPGVTIMDILNYNLLELHYQTGFDFQQYLTPPARDELDFSSVGLLPANELFSPSVVSPHDYENLIGTRVKGVKQCEVRILSGNRYRIYIEVDDEQQAPRLISEVENLYHSHRNLCENLEAVLVKKISRRKRKNQTSGVEYKQASEKVAARNAFTAPHTSVQYDFPDTYGINRQGLIPSASQERQAKALQLKGYLLIFDYLLSAGRQQLGNLHRMFELSGQISPPFSPQMEAGDLDMLVDNWKLRQTELFRTDELHSQKSAYLDMLDTLYGEDTSFIARNPQLSPDEINRRRATLIRRLPQLNAHRFRSFNITDPSLQSTSGIQMLMQALWNNSQPPEITLEALYARYRLRLVADEALYDNDSLFSEFSSPIVAGNIENLHAETEPVPVIQLPPGRKKYKAMRKRLHFFSHNILLQSLPEFGTQPENYRFRKTGFRDNAILLYKPPSGKRWLNMGFFDTTGLLIETANVLWDFLQTLNSRCTSFYVIENLLLQLPSQISGEGCNVLHLVFPAWRKSFYEKNEYLKHLHQRLPIHIEAWITWLPFEEFYRFEQHYYSWRVALATGNDDLAHSHAEEMKELLKNEE